MGGGGCIPADACIEKRVRIYTSSVQDEIVTHFHDINAFEMKLSKHRHIATAG